MIVLSSDKVDKSRRKFITVSVGGLVAGAAGGFLGGYLAAPSKEVTKEVVREVTLTAAKPPPSKVSLVIAPIFSSWALSEYMKEHGIWDKYAEKYNTEITIQYNLDDFAVWAARKVDVGLSGGMETARLRGGGVKGDEPPWDVVQFGRDHSPYPSVIMVRSNSTYKTLADLKGKNVGLPGWDTAAAQYMSVFLKSFYGMNLDKDFNVKIAPWGALEELLVRGDVDAIATVKQLSVSYILSNEIKELMNYGDFWLEHAGNWGPGIPSVSNFTAFSDFVQNNPYAALALIEAYDEGLSIMAKDPAAIIRAYPKFLGDLDEKQMQWAIDNIFTQPRAENLPGAFLTEDIIIGETNFMRLAVDTGIWLQETGMHGFWKMLNRTVHS